MFFISHQEEKRVVGYSTDQEPFVKEFEFDRPGNKTSHLAVSPEYIVAVAKSSLIFYNRVTQKTVVHTLGRQPGQVHFDNTNCLLVSSVGFIKKYRIKNVVDDPVELWCCDVNNSPCSVTTMENGLVIAAHKDALYVISEQGKLLLFTHNTSRSKLSQQLVP